MCFPFALLPSLLHLEPGSAPLHANDLKPTPCVSSCLWGNQYLARCMMERGRLSFPSDVQGLCRKLKRD